MININNYNSKLCNLKKNEQKKYMSLIIMISQCSGIDKSMRQIRCIKNVHTHTCRQAQADTWGYRRCMLMYTIGHGIYIYTVLYVMYTVTIIINNNM